jgi:hypothetical protein
LSTLEVVRRLSDDQVAQVVRALFNQVYTKIPFDQVRANCASAPAVASLADLGAGVLGRKLEAADSVRLGRVLLEQFAGDPNLAPFVDEAWSEVGNSDDLVVETLLALGLVVNLTLLIVTTKVTVERDQKGRLTWRIEKRTADAKLVKSIVGPLTKLAGTAS